MYIDKYKHTHTYICIYVDTYVLIWICSYTYICVYVFIYVHIYVYAYHLSLCRYKHIYIFIYVTYTYTYYIYIICVYVCTSRTKLQEYDESNIRTSASFEILLPRPNCTYVTSKHILFETSKSRCFSVSFLRSFMYGRPNLVVFLYYLYFHLCMVHIYRIRKYTRAHYS